MSSTDIIRAIALIVFLGSAAFGCTCVDGPLARRYREAKAVFVGGLYEFENEEIPKIQNYRDGLPVLLVKRSWKGVNRELIAVDFDFPTRLGSCPLLTKFEDGIDYLVFAYGKNMAVRAECSDTRKLTTEYRQINRDRSRLDSSWFRLKAKIWPF